jgi:UV excision repair protein RAD23
MQLIAQYPAEFEQIILGEEGAEGGAGGQQGGQGGHPPGTILISQEEEQAINRLRQLGFSKIEAAQAYFACDKNE